MQTAPGNSDPQSRGKPPSKPPHRFNDWGQRIWIVAPADKSGEIKRDLSALSFSSKPREPYRATKLTDFPGGSCRFRERGGIAHHFSGLE